MTSGGCCTSSWLGVSLFIVALSFTLQPSLGGPVLQPVAATANSGETHVREDNFESRVRRGITSVKEYAWPNPTIPYLISEQFSEDEREVLLSAMEWWTIDTCLQFVQHTNESQYLYFIQSSSCWSPVGRQPETGPQTVQINQQCLDNVGSVAHQVGHALGFWHEHQRPDRDKFVEVLYDNIPQAYHHLFYKIPEIDSLSVSYDYGSIMHISLFTFSFDKNTPSLRLLKGYDGEVGQRRNTSESDREQVRLFYGCQGVPSQLVPTPTPTLMRIPLNSLQSLASLPFPPLPQSHLSPSPSSSLFKCQSTLQCPQSITYISPLTSPFLQSSNLTLQTTIVTAQSASFSSSSLSWPATTMDPSALPTPSTVTQPSIEMPFIIAAGVEFGMRIVAEPIYGNLWMTCKGERSKTCRLSQCPSEHGLHEQRCQGSRYILEKINGSSNASIIIDRDWVVLRPSIDVSSIVHCGDENKNKGKAVCKYSSIGCGLLGEFEAESCSYHIMEVHLDKNNRSGGSYHRRVTLYFLGEEKTSWLGCNLHDKMKCKRFYCENTQSCTPDKFELVEVS